MAQYEQLTIPQRPVAIGVWIMLHAGEFVAPLYALRRLPRSGPLFPRYFRGLRRLGRQPKTDCYGKPWSWCTTP